MTWWASRGRTAASEVVVGASGQRRYLWVQRTVDVQLRIDHPRYGKAGELEKTLWTGKTGELNALSGDVVAVKPGHMRQVLHPGGIAVYKALPDADSGRPVWAKAMSRLGLVPPSPTTGSGPRGETFGPSTSTSSLDRFVQDQRAGHEGPLVFALPAHQGDILYGSLAEQTIAEAVHGRLAERDGGRPPFGAISVASWSRMDRQPSQADRGQQRVIKRCGAYLVDVNLHGDHGRTWAVEIEVKPLFSQPDVPGP